MKTIRIRTWDGFKKEIRDIKEKYGIIHCGTPLEDENTILFRGHADHRWKLETTLERSSKEPFTINKYLQRATSVAKEIESFTGKHWNLPSYPEIDNEIEKMDSAFLYLPCYEYLVYLRHFGFPSPLLDWTRSPYIALFFAFAEAKNEVDPAIFTYVGSVDGCRGGWVGDPKIDIHGPHVKTDKRHFSQQAEYTTASIYDGEGEKHKFINHEDVFKLDNPEQDILYKIILPYSIKGQVLQELTEYNINYFTLYHNEDSLIKWMGLREFLID